MQPQNPKPNDGPPYWTAQQISNRYQVHVISVRRWITEGRLKPTRLGRLVRISAAELQRFEREGGAREG